MAKLEAILSFVAVGTSIIIGAHSYNEYSLRRVEKNFPTIVQDLERTYGRLPIQPTLERQKMEWYIGGQAQKNAVIGINKSVSAGFLTLYVIGAREDLVQHEVAHLVVRKMLIGATSRWLVNEGDKLHGRDVTWWRQEGVVLEGGAEYIARKQGSKGNTEYESEYQFIKPLIERNGLKETLWMMAADPPTNEEIDRPEIYYKRKE
jgi:hypothetical protein